LGSFSFSYKIKNTRFGYWFYNSQRNDSRGYIDYKKIIWIKC
jgi:hypothetical protein